MKKIYKESIKFIIFLVIILKLTPYLMDMISNSWDSNLMNSISNIIKTVDPSGISIFITFIIGFYIGSAILLFIDTKKRVQGFILLIGVIIIYEYMSSHFTVGWNILYIFIGSIVGGYLGFDFRNEELNKKEFKKAASNVSLFSVIYAAISLVILYSSTNINRNFIQDAIVLIIFSYFFGKLMSYEIKGSTIFILGPEKSGKTLFMAGCYKRVATITSTSTDRSDDLIDLMKELLAGWAKRTRDIKDYHFKYVTGKLFPRESILSAIDYPGVFLADIAHNMYTDGTNKDGTTNDKLKAAHKVMDADKLIFIIDSARYPNFGEMGIDHYLKIVTKLRENGKNIKPYIVITKCDIFKDKYPNYEEDYEGFKNFIEGKFSENLFVKELLNECSNKTLYPVFYYTKLVEIVENTDTNTEEDTITRAQITQSQNPEIKKYEYIPIQDAFGNIHTYGFDVFMNELMEND